MSNIAIENVSLPEGNMKQIIGSWSADFSAWELRHLHEKKIPSNIVEIMNHMSIANLR